MTSTMLDPQSPAKNNEIPACAGMTARERKAARRAALLLYYHTESK